MTSANMPIRVVAIGGTLRENSTSLWALQHALAAARDAGASTQLLDLRRAQLPILQPDWELVDYDENVRDFINVIRHADAFLFSTAGFHGTLAGVTKNALDYFEYLSEGPNPYLHNKPVGLIATASGDQAATNSIRAMVDVVHSLRGYVLPLSVPIHAAEKAFDSTGHPTNERITNRLTQQGRMLVETAARLKSNPTVSLA